MEQGLFIISHVDKRILFVTYGWNESGGGTQFPRAVACELVQRGYQVRVMYASLQDDPTLPPCSVLRLEENGVQLYGMINRPAPFTDPDNPQREVNDHGVRQAFCGILDEVQPNLVHFHNFHGLTFSIAEEVHHRNIPSCFTPHNYHLIDPELYLLKNGLIRWDSVDPLAESDAVARNPHLKEWYLKRFETARRVVNEWVDLTVAVSARQKELLEQFGCKSERIAVIHQTSPAADRLWADPIISKEVQRKIQKPLQVGYIGGVIPIKGIQMLVAAAQNFEPDTLNVHVYGFADPAFEELLRESDRKRMVHFHGAFEAENLPEIARKIDVAVLPSIVEESAPTLVLAELFAMRIPVIASRVGGIPEFISSGVDGELYPPYDIEALINVLKTFVDNPSQLETMRRNLMTPTHTFALYMEHIEKVYENLLSGKAINTSYMTLMAACRQITKPKSLPRISWHGGLFANNSLAHVNRELCLQLLRRGFSISFTRTEPDDFNSSVTARFTPLESICATPTDTVDVTIRHQWPPDFMPVASGKLVLIQPWEFGSLPKHWIAPFSTTVDEVWVPSKYVRECYISSGVPAERVQVVPNGVDTATLTPDASPLPLNTSKKFRFLFVGGTIHRKGIDLLLGAYHRSFTAKDDVCLVIKDMGGSSVYEGQTAQDTIKRFMQTSGSPEIEYIDRALTPNEMASLYTACHCLVHPYRGEGFGLPIAEAMSCGLPPIVTGYGAALDFCNQDNAWLIPATIEKMPIKQIGTYETVNTPWLAEPDFSVLCDLMKYAAAHTDEVRARGQLACRHIRENFTWEMAAEKASERLQVLASRQTAPSDSTDYLPDSDTTRGQLLANVCATARALYQRGDSDSAIQTLLNQGIKFAPDSPVPYLELSEILIATRRHAEALQVLPEMPSSTDQTLKYEIEALCQLALGDDCAAEHAATYASGRPRAMVVLGTLAARRGDMISAESFFRRAIDTSPVCSSGWLSLGILLWGKEQREEAWQAVKSAFTADPLNEETITIIRDMASRLGYVQEILPLFSDACGRYPYNRRLAHNRAELVCLHGEPEDALNISEEFVVRCGVDEAVLDLSRTLRHTVGVHDSVKKSGSRSISLCMIVKNEENCLARCLASVKPVVHEMIVVDTGSSDHTIEIAELFGARVSSFPWNGNFSDARNHSINQASGDWVLVMDADEVLSGRDYDNIRGAVASSGKESAWSVVTRNYTNRVNTHGWTANDSMYPDEEKSDGWYPSIKVRLFPNLPEVRFSGTVHEMVESSLRESGYAINTASFVVHHYGELEAQPNDPEKQRRYFEAGLQKLKETPDDLAAIAELAVQAGELGEFETALQLWDRILAKIPDAVEALFNKGYCLMGLMRYDEALIVSRRAIELDSNHKEAAFNYGTCELYVGDHKRALQVVHPMADRHMNYPLLQALSALLLLADGRTEEAKPIIEALNKNNYAIHTYIQDRVATLEKCGRNDLARTILAGSCGS